MINVAISGLLAILSSKFLEYEMNNFDNDIKVPIDTVSIILPTLNEEKYIGSTISSIVNQSILGVYPQYFDLIMVDSGSKDRTVEIAKHILGNQKTLIYKIIEVPIRGKLTAKNLAIDQSKGNIIVSIDSDCYYDYHWLNTIIRPFENTSVVAVTGSRFDYNSIIPGEVITITNYIDKKILSPIKITGMNSAYWKHLFYLTGRFNENINQLDKDQVQQEEEYDLGTRLSKYGDVLFKLNVSCIHLGGFRGICRLGFFNEQCINEKITIDRF